MWWKVYFWILLVLSSIGFISLTIEITKFSLGDWIGALLSIITVAATYSFAFKKKLASVKTWKIIFWTFIGFLVFTIIIEIEPTKTLKGMTSFLEPTSLSEPSSTLETIITLALILPAYYALYKLGHTKGKK